MIEKRGIDQKRNICLDCLSFGLQMMSALWHVVDGAGDRISKEDLAKSP
jgi:hypothetical protein